MEIETGVIKGNFPKTALKLVIEWYEINKDLLMENWGRAQDQGDLLPIPPLT